MTNNDLISRAAAIEYFMTNMVWHDEDGYEVDDADEKRAIITDFFDGIPAVDAVPVVRCKDCHYWHQELDEVHHWYCTYGWAHQTTPDHYCADGKRRDGE